jgi:general secretion pathway protein C
MPLHQLDTRARAEFWRGALRSGIEVALVLVLAAQTARVVWIIADPSGPLGTPVAEGVAVSDTDLAILKTFNAFAPRGPTVASVEGIDGLSLFGVRVGSRGTGSAIIASAGKQSVYWVGEEVAPGAVLKEVAADHVAIAHDKSISRLALVARNAPPNATASVPSYMVAPRPSAPAKPAVVTSIDTKKLLEEAGLRPRTQDGQITGYTLLPRGAGETLGRAGLAAGDVLVALNGNRLTPERYSEIEQELTGAPQVQITVERGNETKTITLQTGR